MIVKFVKVKFGHLGNAFYMCVKTGHIECQCGDYSKRAKRTEVLPYF
jgi:hypothetical protein